MLTARDYFSGSEHSTWEDVSVKLRPSLNRSRADFDDDEDDMPTWRERLD
jgi:hypothetical protein